jgi:putative membrane protein
MRYMSWHYVAAAVSIAAISSASCKGQQTADKSAGMSDTASFSADTVQSAGASGGDLSDANIVALLDEANMADSSSGAYALTKATSPDVKAFAKLMMGEHHSLRMQGQQLAKKLGVTPQPPASDPLPAAASAEMEALRAAPKGKQFDQVYIEQEIGIHKAVIDLAGKAKDAAQNEQLRSLIEQASPVIQKHLKQAEAIQKKLGKQTA